MIREWKSEEVDRAIESIKAVDSQLWNRYIEIEELEGRITDEDGLKIRKIIYQKIYFTEKFNNKMFRETSNLILAIRIRTRKDLNLEWDKGNSAGLT